VGVNVIDRTRYTVLGRPETIMTGTWDMGYHKGFPAQPLTSSNVGDFLMSAGHTVICKMPSGLWLNRAEICVQARHIISWTPDCTQSQDPHQTTADGARQGSVQVTRMLNPGSPGLKHDGFRLIMYMHFAEAGVSICYR
jgi:hypothetical protein